MANTSVAAFLLVRLAELPMADCTHAGTGLDAAGMARKSTGPMAQPVDAALRVCAPIARASP
ncbi:MAG: nicotinate-nucleotide--dimethylbenzimidazole phosphoribosyltransferase [Candidatus Desulfobacillus denitrificans]